MCLSFTTGILRTVTVIAAFVFAARAACVAQSVAQPALRAAFLYNFAKFTEWPASDNPTAPVTLCILDDGSVEKALSDLVTSNTVNGRAVAIAQDVSARLRTCHIVYFGETSADRVSATHDELRGAAVLTVGDGEEFVRSGGIVGLFVDDGRMRFAINPDAAQRAGVRLSSRLLHLAKILGDHHP